MADPFEPTKLPLKAICELLDTLNLGDDVEEPTAVVVYPDKYDDVKKVGKDDLPLIIVQEQWGESHLDKAAAGGKAYFHWTAEIVVLLAKGPHVYPSPTAAEAEMTLKYWRSALWKLFGGNMTLKGTVEMIGAMQENQFRLMTETQSIWQWNGEPYLAWLFLLPIKQAVTISFGS